MLHVSCCTFVLVLKRACLTNVVVLFLLCFSFLRFGFLVCGLLASISASVEGQRLQLKQTSDATSFSTCVVALLFPAVEEVL